MLLPSKAQIILFWGPDFIVLYNDAYRPVFGAKHPHALGRPGREAWSEIWDSMLHELLAGVVRTGEAFWAKDLLFSSSDTASSRRPTSTSPTIPSASRRARSAASTASSPKPPSAWSARAAWRCSGISPRATTARTTREACEGAMETLPHNRRTSLCPRLSRRWAAERHARRRCNWPQRRPISCMSCRCLRRRQVPRGPARRRPESAASVRRAVPRIPRSRRRPAGHARSRTRAPTRRSGSAPRRSPSSTARRRRSSRTSATSSGRR